MSGVALVLIAFAGIWFAVGLLFLLALSLGDLAKRMRAPRGCQCMRCRGMRPE